MKVFSLSLLVLPIAASAQITINSAHLPNANDVLVQHNCALTGNVNLESTGANYTWTFDSNTITDLGLAVTTNCIDVANAPFVYQLFFNNPFDPAHNSDYCVGVESFTIATITFQDVYRYYRNHGGIHSFVGAGWTINNVPLPSWSDPVDVIYELPVEFGDNTSSYSEIETTIPTLGTYNLKQTRTNAVDGWGQLVLWGQTYNVLRVRTEITAQDSIYSDFLGFGFTIPRPLAVEYKWLSQQFKVPVLQINTTAGIVSQVLTPDLSVGIVERNTPELLLYPNPVQRYAQISGLSSAARLVVRDITGRDCLSTTITPNESIDLGILPAGHYKALVSEVQGGQHSISFSKQ